MTSADLQIDSNNTVLKHETEDIEIQDAKRIKSNGNCLTKETDFGILEYVNKDTKGFYGLIKERYSDFLVNEVDLKGNKVTLNKWITPIIETKEEEIETDELDVSEELKKWFSEENVAIILNHEKGMENDVFSNSIIEKADRTAVHVFFKKYFHGNLITDTASDQRIKVHKANGKEKMNDRKRSNANKIGRYLYFHMYKENKDTSEAIQKIAKMLNVYPKVFSYAGTKDRRAVTVQQVVVENMSIERLAKVNGKLHQILVSDPKYTDKPLKLGELKGNMFTITIRAIDSVRNANEGFLSLKESGFVNYFGMQRFGTSELPTNLIGKALFAEDYQKAVDLILHAKNDDQPEVKEAKRLWKEEKNAAKALELFPYRFIPEIKILTYFKKNAGIDANSYKKAFDSISWEMRTMYVHSFQSHIWNLIASTRLRKLGFKPVIGDLVMDKNGEAKYIGNENDLETFEIFDVVLPLPGHAVVYPTNEIKLEYERLQQDYGINFHEKNKNSLLNLPGSYRHVIVKPANLNWQFRKYDDPTIPLTKTDKMKLEGAELDDAEPETAKHCAAIVEFELPTSSYATMAMREVMKMETSSQFQKTL